MMTRLVLAVALLTGVAMAQSGGRKGGGSSDMSGGAPRQYSANRFDIIAEALNLNKDQKKTVRTILDDGAKEAAPLRDQLSKSRIVVGEAIVANKSVEDLKQVAKSASDLGAQLAQLELKTFAKIFGTLDDTQKKDIKGVGRVLNLTNGMYHSKNWIED
jgi:hypothetical protein